MNTKLTIIVDNTSTGLLKGEWGLSVLVEYNDKKILVDAGASDLFLKNMRGLGIEVKDIDYGVLSHAHYDHANGIPAFFENNDKSGFYIRDSVDANCYGTES